MSYQERLYGNALDVGAALTIYYDSPRSEAERPKYVSGRIQSIEYDKGDWNATLSDRERDDRQITVDTRVETVESVTSQKTTRLGDLTLVDFDARSDESYDEGMCRRYTEIHDVHRASFDPASILGTDPVPRDAEPLQEPDRFVIRGAHGTLSPDEWVQIALIDLDRWCVHAMDYTGDEWVCLETVHRHGADDPIGRADTRARTILTDWRIESEDHIDAPSMYSRHKQIEATRALEDEPEPN